MTKVTYLVGLAEIASYADAREWADELNLPIVPKYTEITEHSPKNKKRMEYIANGGKLK